MKTNKWGQDCTRCGGYVAANSGTLLHDRDADRWLVFCGGDGCVAKQAASVAAPAKTNAYDAPCSVCRTNVEPRKGSLVRSPKGAWVVTHLDRAACEAGTATRQSAPSDLPDVPAGHYATPSRTGNNDLDFWRVDRPTEGKYAGKTFVKRVIGGHPDQNVRWEERKLALEAIVAAGIEAAGAKYGQELGRCCCCNRTLTDETSRELGIGPDCRSQRQAA